MEIRFTRKYSALMRGREMARYDIFINNESNYYAEAKQFVITYTTGLYTTNFDDTINLRLTVKQVLSIRPHYHIKLLNGTILTFKTISFWGGHFQCAQEGSVFDIFYYREGICTVYENDHQIALIELPTRHSGIVQVEKDCDYELVMAFVLIMDRSTLGSGQSFYFNPINALFYAGVGVIKPFAKQLDPAWHPKR